MTAQKLSISLDSDSLEFLDEYQQRHGSRSRSEVLARALRALRDHELEADYEAAMRDLAASGDLALWEATSGDSLGDEPRAARCC